MKFRRVVVHVSLSKMKEVVIYYVLHGLRTSLDTSRHVPHLWLKTQKDATVKILSTDLPKLQILVDWYITLFIRRVTSAKMLSYLQILMLIGTAKQPGLQGNVRESRTFDLTVPSCNNITMESLPGNTPSLRTAFSDPEIISIWSSINVLKVYSVMRLQLKSTAMIYAL